MKRGFKLLAQLSTSGCVNADSAAGGTQHGHPTAAAAPLHLQVPWVLLPDLHQREAAWAKHSNALLGGSTTLTLSGGAEVTLSHRPLSLEVRLGGQPALRFDSEGMLNYEHRREKQARRHATTVHEGSRRRALSRGLELDHTLWG